VEDPPALTLVPPVENSPDVTSFVSYRTPFGTMKLRDCTAFLCALGFVQPVKLQNEFIDGF
jgi:hypothetical protein